jgi:hypothetical protein
LDAEPPRIIFENSAQCADGNRLEGPIRSALRQGHTAIPGWNLRMHIDRTRGRVLRAEGTLTDERGSAVARRTLQGVGPDCASLARAVGVWASLVLDAESRRPRTAAAEAQPPAPPSAKPDPAPLDVAEASQSETNAHDSGVGAWPSPPPQQIEDKPSEVAPPVRHREAGTSTFELGLSGFMMTGAGGSAVAGASPFVFLDAGSGIYLRPSLAFGATVSSPSEAAIHTTWLNSRLDTCFRWDGLYASPSGLQFDLCGGADLGATLPSGRADRAYFALGPSVDLRGDLGSGLAATLRGVVGINLLHDPNHEADEEVPLVAGRIEVAVSWGVR